jgi:hypothetical protein
MQSAGKQQSSLQKRRPSLGTAIFVLRATLAISLLAVLLGAGWILPAAASGPMCTLACCAGRAPHAAGSCMQGSCETESSDHHAHHQQSQSEFSDASSPFPGVVAGAHGSNMENVPTVDASDSREVTRQNSSGVPAFSTAALVKPCESGCGAGATITITGKKTRDGATNSSVNHKPTSSSLRLKQISLDARTLQVGFGQNHIPRGPPTSFSF